MGYNDKEIVSGGPVLLSYISSLFSDPLGTLGFFLLAFPGRILALSAHEFAHAWMADRCGDPTARMYGRLTLNPLKHLDPVGTLFMLLLGFGWARPVPVNPCNFRNFRRDDLKVSLAGVTMNMILFVLGFIAASIMFIIAILKTGQTYFFEFVRYPVYQAEFISAVLGVIPGYIYQMLVYFVYVNISLAVFNLLPVPPLDGYHVLNDLLLKRSLFASQKAARTSMGILYLLMFTGILGRILSFIVETVISGAGLLLELVCRLGGLF